VTSANTDYCAISGRLFARARAVLRSVPLTSLPTDRVLGLTCALAVGR